MLEEKHDNLQEADGHIQESEIEQVVVENQSPQDAIYHSNAQ